MRRYRNHIGSLALALLTHLAAAVTVLALGFLVGYVLIRGESECGHVFARVYLR